MKRRLLGNTGVELSEVGFGAWQIGADWGTEIPKDLAISSLHAAVDAGIKCIGFPGNYHKEDTFNMCIKKMNLLDQSIFSL